MTENLEIQERIFNKSYKAALCNLKCEGLTNIILDMEKDRTQDLRDLEMECVDIKKCLTTFTENIFTNDIDSHDIAGYKKNLVDIERKINKLKVNINKQREDLEQKEKELIEEIITLQKIISSEEIKSTKSPRKIAPIEKILISQMPIFKSKEVELFQTFLMKTGGHTGGWGATEHGIFLHCWDKCYGESLEKTLSVLSSTRLISLIQKKLPVISDEEIEAHKIWYLKYLSLKESQTKFIEMWKAIKEVNKCYKKVSEVNEDDPDKIVQKKISSVKNIALEEWKKNKENEERLALEQQALDNINKKEEQVSKFKMNRLARQINKKWIEAKKMEMEKVLNEDLETTKQEKCKKASEANKKIKEFRQRDQQIVNSRKSLINKNKIQTQKLTILTKKPQRFLRSKYHELTEQWRRRISKNESTESILSDSRAVYSVDYLPKLGIPKWRQAMV